MSSIEFMGIASMLFVGWFTWNEAKKKDEGDGQSKRASLVEAWTNIVIGFTVNFVANFWLIPMMTGVDLPHSANFWGGWVYTTVSIVRQYVIRRWFNAQLTRMKARLS